MWPAQGGQLETLGWHTPCVTDTGPVATLRAATVRRKRAETNLKAARRSESHAALDAVLAGVTQADVARITGYTREHVRRITDAARDERGLPRPQRPERQED